MFNSITPEQAGISSNAVLKFIRKLEQRGLYSHGILMMRGDDIFCEGYWAPWNKDSIHRMYSQTKSFVGIAIGLLEEEGKLALTDKIAKHFPEKIHTPLNSYLSELTIRDMLLMETTGQPARWFDDLSAVDRTEHYFRTVKATRPSGMYWAYDSAGSQVLCSLVEKLSGMCLLEYMKKKLFNKLGTFQTATVLKTRNNDSWGDSGMVCTLRDIASFAWLLKNNGVYNGEQLINAEYIKTATSRLVDNDSTGFTQEFPGYGYQIWQPCCGGFAFVGMGQQLTIVIPEKDFLFTYYSNNQGFDTGRCRIVTALEDFILDELQDTPLPADPEAYQSYCDYMQTLTLKHIEGPVDSDFAEKINGVTYLCEENPTGITQFRFDFMDNHSAQLHYRNAQGDKVIPFGLGKNAFCKFPQYGYSDLHGGCETDNGFLYDCAASASWREEQKLVLKVQINDKYLGSMYAVFSFRDDFAYVNMKGIAENFLKEYNGQFNAKAQA